LFVVNLVFLSIFSVQEKKLEKEIV